MKKVYTHEQVTFGSKGPKWHFSGPNGFAYITPLVGGRETAEKVAVIVNASLKRTKGGGLDNLGRANIRSINEKAVAALRNR